MISSTTIFDASTTTIQAICHLDKWTARIRGFIGERVPNAALILPGAANVQFYEISTAGRSISSERYFVANRGQVPREQRCGQRNMAPRHLQDGFHVLLLAP